MIYVGPDWVCAPYKSGLKNRIYTTFNLHWSTSHHGNNQRGRSQSACVNMYRYPTEDQQDMIACSEGSK